MIFTRQGFHVYEWRAWEITQTIAPLIAPSCALGPDGRGPYAHRSAIHQIPLFGEFHYVPR